MKTSFKSMTLLAVLALSLKAQADGLYDITFTDGGDNVGSGRIDVENGFAVSGYFTVTVGTASGSWTLAGGTVAYPGQLTSPAGAFYYDNAVYLGSNPAYPSTNVFLDNAGLLFADTSGNEINLWGSADGTYSFYGAINNNRYDPQAVGVATITAVPEPVDLAACALLLVPAGAFLRRRLQSESCTTRS